MLRIIAIVLAIGFAAPAIAQDEPRLALLIGNESYPASVGQLSQSHGDVERMANALESVGFDVTTIFDADEDYLELAIATFATALSNEGEEATGFFYYAGHGASAVIRGERRNYLIPSNEEITDVTTLSVRGVEEEDVIDALSEANVSAIFVVIDACRNELVPALGSRTVSERGFGVTAARPGLFIAHSTFPGQTAPDDGAFSRALAAEISSPGRHASRAFELAYRRVADRREGYALPTVATSLRSDFCFVSCPEQTSSAAEAAYLRAVESDSPDVYQAFLVMFPDSARADDIRERVAAHPASGESLLTTDPIDAVIVTLNAMDTLEPNYSSRRALDAIVGEYGFGPLLAAAERGDANAANIAGFAFHRGVHTLTDNVRAAGLWQTACDEGVQLACSNLGVLYGLGSGVVQDLDRAISLYRGACNQGWMGGCENLAAMYLNGSGVTQDTDEAEVLYVRSCEGGSARGCREQGSLHRDRGEHEQAVALFERSCDLDYALGCNDLGLSYSRGEGVDRDDAVAERLYQTACDGGVAWGCHNVGTFRETGRAGSVDRDEAIRYYVRAVELTPGFSESINALRNLNAHEEACAAGHGRSCWDLGRNHHRAPANERSYGEAVRYYSRACELSYMDGCNSAAWIMATAPDDETRSGDEAVRYARMAVDSAPSTYTWRDTLAAAYAEAGRFNEAVREQEAAIAAGGSAEGFAQRLELYRQHRPYREE